MTDVTLVQEARQHLYSAITQSIPADDQIIMNHVRAAHELLGAIGRPSGVPDERLVATLEKAQAWIASAAIDFKHDDNDFDEDHSILREVDDMLVLAKSGRESHG